MTADRQTERKAESSADDLRARLEAAGARVTPQELEWLLSTWDKRRIAWEKLRREDLDDTSPSAVSAPLSDGDLVDP